MNFDLCHFEKLDNCIFGIFITVSLVEILIKMIVVILVLFH